MNVLSDTSILNCQWTINYYRPISISFSKTLPALAWTFTSVIHLNFFRCRVSVTIYSLSPPVWHFLHFPSTLFHNFACFSLLCSLPSVLLEYSFSWQVYLLSSFKYNLILVPFQTCLSSLVLRSLVQCCQNGGEIITWVYFNHPKITILLRNSLCFYHPNNFFFLLSFPIFIGCV